MKYVSAPVDRNEGCALHRILSSNKQRLRGVIIHLRRTGAEPPVGLEVEVVLVVIRVQGRPAEPQVPDVLLLSSVENFDGFAHVARGVAGDVERGCLTVARSRHVPRQLVVPLLDASKILFERRHGLSRQILRSE